LKLIVGIGPVLERRLNKLGVFRFKQIARWRESDIERIAQQLRSFGDRITREKWIDGAKKLHKEKYNEEI
jgi:predicted flap endonuclease-1-like 5' DNA nuclease